MTIIQLGLIRYALFKIYTSVELNIFAPVFLYHQNRQSFFYSIVSAILSLHLGSVQRGSEQADEECRFRMQKDSGFAQTLRLPRHRRVLATLALRLALSHR